MRKRKPLTLLIPRGVGARFRLHHMSLCVLLLLFLQAVYVLAFVAPQTAQTQTTHAIRSSWLYAASASARSTKEVSIELLTLLQSKQLLDARTYSTLSDEINSLVGALIEDRVSFDPARCIDGGLYRTVHFIGKTPLWERIGSSSNNVKGQKFTLDEDASGNFVNYAEIFGPSFYLKAVGDCFDKGPVSAEMTESADRSPFGSFFSAFGYNSTKKKFQAPYDFTAQVSGASIVLFQKLEINIPIEGTGTVRVLYADENLRIFVSPSGKQFPVYVLKEHNGSTSNSPTSHDDGMIRYIGYQGFG